MCSVLKNSNLKKQEIARVKELKPDELEYIYLTSTGTFWDSVIDEEVCKANGLLRSDVKVLMFREVFYSNKKGVSWKKYAKAFIDRFPDVYKLINRIKFGSNPQNLPNLMMKKESELFWEILRRLYKNRFKVINIHDAIVVPDIKANKKCTPEIVTQVIEDVYKENGLLPNVSTDFYGEEVMRKHLADNQTLSNLTADFVTKLREQSNTGNEEAALLLKDIEQGEVELLLNKERTGVIKHRRNV